MRRGERRAVVAVGVGTAEDDLGRLGVGLGVGVLREEMTGEDRRDAHRHDPGTTPLVDALFEEAGVGFEPASLEEGERFRMLALQLAAEPREL